MEMECARGAFFIVGWRSGEGGGDDKTLHLAAYRGTALVYVGTTEVDLSGAAGRRLQALMDKVKARRPEFPGPVPSSGIQWLQPVLIADMRFYGWAQDGTMVNAVYKGLRRRQDNADVFRV
jgi:bifunctional non-homologous end joining protein LigD